MNSTTLSARDRILLTAHDLFYSEGIRATGIDRIIKQAGVTKVTFYRHFPSKNNLILEFLDYRHQHWIMWFKEAIVRNGKQPESLVATLLEWFESDTYRGCAFINSVGELGETLPEVVLQSQQHKQEMTDIIKTILPDAVNKGSWAAALAIAVDGAIIRAQIDQKSDSAIAGMKTIITALFPENNT